MTYFSKNSSSSTSSSSSGSSGSSDDCSSISISISEYSEYYTYDTQSESQYTFTENSYEDSVYTLEEIPEEELYGYQPSYGEEQVLSSVLKKLSCYYGRMIAADLRDLVDDNRYLTDYVCSRLWQEGYSVHNNYMLVKLPERLQEELPLDFRY